MKELTVYNLEFPDYIDDFNVAGYKFKRVANYDDALAGLQHTVESMGGEFTIKLNTGTHQGTALVEIPDSEDAAILPWDKEGGFKKLQDVLLLLSLFRGRNIFALNPGEEKFPLRPDPRRHFYGGQFRLSVRHDDRWRNKSTGEIIGDDKMAGRNVYDYTRYDLGVESTVNEVIATISSKAWLEKFDGGYILFLFRQAIGQNYIEPAFMLCWTIWEHLFATDNRKWLDSAAIEQMSGDKKVSYIINKYLLVSIDEKARKEIKRIAQARNRLVHYGKKADNVEFKEMELFIRLTEQVMAIVLGLQPSNAFNSFERLNALLKASK
jgi:hypothetical protein